MRQLLEKIRWFIRQLPGMQYKRIGSCQQCGECCRTITLKFPDKLITRETEFVFLKTRMSRFESFFISGRADNGVLLFTCKFLKDNKCSIHWFRSVFCRAYPHFSHKFIKMGGQPLPGCGFGYKPIVTFSEVFEKLNS